MLLWVQGRVWVAKGEDGWFGVEPRRGRLSDRTSHNDNYRLSGPDFAPARPWASQWRSLGAECFI